MAGSVGGEGVVLDKRGMRRDQRGQGKARAGRNEGRRGLGDGSKVERKIDNGGNSSSKEGHHNLGHDPPILTLFILHLHILIVRCEQRSKHIPSSKPRARWSERRPSLLQTVSSGSIAARFP